MAKRNNSIRHKEERTQATSIVSRSGPDNGLVVTPLHHSNSTYFGLEKKCMWRVGKKKKKSTHNLEVMALYLLSGVGIPISHHWDNDRIPLRQMLTVLLIPLSFTHFQTFPMYSCSYPSPQICSFISPCSKHWILWLSF